MTVIHIGLTIIAIRVMLEDACWIIFALKDGNFILTLVYAYQMDCRRNTSDFLTYVLTFKCQDLYPDVEHQFQVSVARGDSLLPVSACHISCQSGTS